MKRLSLMAGCLLLSWNACAAEVEGVKLPDTLHVGQRSLVLNGAGVRTRFFLDMYVAALYLKEKNASSDAILSDDSENRIELHMLRDVSSETLSKLFNEAIRRNLTPAELAALDVQLKQLAVLFSMLSEAKQGDVLTMDYLRGRGTEIDFNDVTIGIIEGAAFNRALLSTWLGKKPAQEVLKKELLGG